MLKILRIVAICTLACVLLAVLGLVGVYRAIQQVPNFYQETLRTEPAQSQIAGDQFERQVLALTAGTWQDGRWREIFTDHQINGWLAVDLVEKLPNLLPPGVQNPRVAIDTDRVRMACRYQGRCVSMVFSLDVQAYLTDEPNVVAVRICSAKAGMLPLPLKRVLQTVSTMAVEANVKLRWAHQEGDPVALVTIPTQHDNFERPRHLEALELRKGRIYVSGRTDSPDASDADPSEPHYDGRQSAGRPPRVNRR